MGNPRHEAQRLAAAQYDNAQAVDMESVGVASTLAEQRKRVDYNPRLVVIRGVSDIDPRDRPEQLGVRRAEAGCSRGERRPTSVVEGLRGCRRCRVLLRAR